MPLTELDVRPLRKPDKHPTIFRAFDELAVGESFVLVNNHDPIHLRDEFETDHAGGFGWEYLERGPEWRVRIERLAETSLPRIVGDVSPAGPARDADDTGNAAGVEWALRMRERDLDSNVVRLRAGGRIDTHRGPDLDVLLVVLDGTGTVTTETGTVELHAGALLWLPRRSRRAFDAGPDGLRYLTVHRRREALVLDPAPPRPAR